MPIKSSFFPKEALQGQDLPSHVLWSDLNFDLIKITHSKKIAFKEVYNVSKDDIIVEERAVTIKKVEVDGYLGIVFSSNLLPEKKVDDKIEFSFFLKDVLKDQLVFSVHLFRAEVALIEVPQKIFVDPNSDKISPKILVRNLGEGTAIIDIETTEESELKKSIPQFVEKFVEETVDRISFGIKKLRNDFKEFAPLLGKIEGYLTKPLKFEETSLVSFEEFEEEFSSAIEKNDTFARALADMFVDILMRNSMFSNVYQFFLDYMNSIGKEKIIIRDPFTVITVSNKPAKLHVRIKCIDLLKQMCSTIDLDPVEVSGMQTGEIALFKLFQWGGQKE